MPSHRQIILALGQRRVPPNLRLGEAPVSRVCRPRIILQGGFHAESYLSQRDRKDSPSLRSYGGHSTTQTFKTLINFDGTDGGDPGTATLVQGTDGSLCGTTPYWGANDGRTDASDEWTILG